MNCEAELALIRALPGAVVKNANADVDAPSPKGYVVYRTDVPIRLDGRLDEDAWTTASWTDDFVDIEGDRRANPRFRTRVKMLWDDQYLYIAASLEEPHVQASYTEHDSYIFHEDNDFEVFIDPDGDNHNYAELEMNALNTTWDLKLDKPYRDGGVANNAWELPGLKTAVYVDGTLNNPADVDRGWTIEIAIPLKLAQVLTSRPGAAGGELPRDGDQWRVNFSRVEWRFDIVNGRYARRKDSREDNWVWSPQWAINMHQPETWGFIQFSTAPPGAANFVPDPAWPAKQVLYRIAAAQRSYWAEHREYATTLDALTLGDTAGSPLLAPPELNADPKQYQATVGIRLPDATEQRWRIRQDSLIWRVP